MPEVISLANTKRVLWDFDGTLYDSASVAHAITWEIAFAWGLPEPGADDVAMHYAGTLEDLMGGLFPGLSARQRRVAAGLFNKLQSATWESGGVFYPDAERLTKRLAVAGISQAIVTSRAHQGKGAASPRAIVASSCLDQRIDSIRCGDEGKAKKPDARAVSGLLLGVPAREVVMIGDQAVDAHLACNIGARAILVDRNPALGIPHLSAVPGERLTIVRSLDEVRVDLGMRSNV